MTVSELINELKNCPEECEVKLVNTHADVIAANFERITIYEDIEQEVVLLYSIK